MLPSAAVRKTIFLLGVFILVAVTSSYSKGKPQKDLSILSIKKHALYFKVSKMFLGGKVEVYDARENFLEAEALPHTHSMIYFDEMPKGVYTIRVRKGDQCTEFKYNNIKI